MLFPFKHSLEDRPGVSPTYLQLKADILRLITVLVVFIAIRGLFGLGMDSTDGPDSRSGMILRIDALTSCHYLESTGGHLIPRQDQQGQHLCNKE